MTSVAGASVPGAVEAEEAEETGEAERTGGQVAGGVIEQRAEAGPRRGRGPALELLVHGVGGTTPADMLGDPHVVRVTGDATAGTYRRWDDRDAESSPGHGDGEPIQEAYSWAHLTSGSGARAFWLLLLPFMVVNLAHWMRPAARRSPRLDAAYDLLVRAAALCLTVLLTSAACEVALDLTVWQCAGSGWCSAHKSWLGFLAAPHGGWWSEPGRRLVVGAAVPLVTVGLLWFLSHKTWAAYEAQRMPGAGDQADWTPGRAMQMPGFWYGMRVVRRLRVAHVAAGLLTVASALTVPALDRDGGVLAGVGWALVVVIALLGAVVVSVLVRTRRSEREMDDATDRWAVRALPWSSLGAVVLSAVYAGWTRPGWVSAGRLPGAEGTMTVLCAVQLVLVALLAAVTARAVRGGEADERPPSGSEESVPGPGRETADGGQWFGGPDGPAFGGLAGAVTVMLGCGLGTLLTAAISVWSANALDRGATPGAPGGHIPGPPILLTWHDAGLPVGLVLLAAVLGVLAFRTVRQQTALRPEVEAAYGLKQGRGSARRTDQIAGALARARLTDAGPVLIGTLAGLAFALGAAALVGSELTHRIPSDAAGRGPVFFSYGVTTAQSLGSWLVGAFAAALIAVGRAAYRRVGIRRTVGVLWDIGTFWPRAAHPFAPPCYAERAVPDLVWRTRAWLAADPDRRLVLSAHSQGTVLAAAAIWQLEPSARRRVALLTYGSPLRRLYGRYFPAYMGPEDLAGLHRDAPAWRNLFRLTDPIGGPVRVHNGDQVDAEPFVDPLHYERDLDGHPLPTPINAHSHYQDDPRFARERAGILREV